MESRLPQVIITKKTRLINENLIQQFTMALKECDWADTRLAIKNGNTAVAYDRFIGNYTEIYNKIFIAVFKKILGTLQNIHGCQLVFSNPAKPRTTFILNTKNSPQKLTKANMLNIVISSKC